MTKRNLPLIGVVLSICLFVLATIFYPGGAYTPATIVGYDWTRHFISTLFATKALNGAANPARAFALPAMLLFCVSAATMFRAVSLQSTSTAVRKTIDIGGIGAMVYAFLAVATPMHDLLVSISLVFFLAALFAMLYMLYRARQRTLLVFGLGYLALNLAAVVMYYGNVFFFTLLPITQKLVFACGTAWLLALYLTRPAPTLAPNDSLNIPHS